jgi:hypothetical protein
MISLDYLLEPIRFSRAEQIHYALFDWPVNFLRMIAWLSIETIQHRMPGRFGRRPDPRTIIEKQHAEPSSKEIDGGISAKVT